MIIVRRTHVIANVHMPPNSCTHSWTPRDHIQLPMAHPNISCDSVCFWMPNAHASLPRPNPLVAHAVAYLPDMDALAPDMHRSNRVIPHLANACSCTLKQFSSNQRLKPAGKVDTKPSTQDRFETYCGSCIKPLPGSHVCVKLEYLYGLETRLSR